MIAGFVCFCHGDLGNMGILNISFLYYHVEDLVAEIRSDIVCCWRS